MEGVENPFAGKGNVVRSPQRRASIPETTSEGLEASLEDAAHASKKRKADSSPEMAKSAAKAVVRREEIEVEIEAVWKKTRELAALIAKNTQVDMKKAIVGIGRAADRLREKADGWAKQAPIPIDIDAMDTEKPRVETAEISTQTLTSEEEEEERRKAAENVKVEQIREKIESAANFRDMAALASKEEVWPRRVFRRTRWVKRSILTEKKARAVVIVEGNAKDAEMLQRLETQFPMVSQVKEKLPVGRTATLTATDSLRIEGEPRAAPEEDPRLLLVAKIGDAGNLEEMAGVIEKMLKKIERADHTEFGLYMSDSVPPERAEKIVECCLVDSTMTAELCGRGKTPRAENGDKKKRKKGGGAANARPVTADVTVTGAGRSYAEILKDLKGSINPDQAGVQFERASRNPDGSLRLRVRETREGGCQNFAQQVSEKAAQLQTVIKKTGAALVAVMIRDLDESTTDEEIRQGLQEALKVGETEASIGAIRKGQNGDSYNAVVRLPRPSASLLLRQGRIRVGWFRCRVHELFSPEYCFNCLEVGHQARQCKQEVCRRRRCYKCGQEGHIAKDCNGAKKCYKCNEEGHYANSMACPVFREHVDAMRAKKTPAPKTADGFEFPRRTYKAPQPGTSVQSDKEETPTPMIHD